MVLLAGCESSPPPPAALRLVQPPPGDIAEAVLRQRKESGVDGHQVLVYVGAPWCEPCRHFHEAAVKGELNDLLGGFDLLEFNLDEDASRLAAAGYGSKMIPLLAVPDERGRGTDRRIEGSIKGDGAVANMRPRIRALLGR